MTKKTRRIAIFASGSGSNAQCIAEYFAGSGSLEIAAIYCNNPEAYVLERARNLGIPSVLFNRDTFYNTEAILDDLGSRKVNFIVLAGFLWLVPGYILQSFQGKIVNIHPALLPKYGGKGMYGMKVHEAVIAAGENQSGITIHLVNEKYDEGSILFQDTCDIEPDETPDSLAGKIHLLEYENYPKVLEEWIKNKS